MLISPRLVGKKKPYIYWLLMQCIYIYSILHVTCMVYIAFENNKLNLLLICEVISDRTLNRAALFFSSPYFFESNILPYSLRLLEYNPP